MMVGCSEYSLLKWERLEYLLRVHARMCRSIIDRRNLGPYVYMDVYAGPGIYEVEHNPDLAGQVGSPIRAARILDEEFALAVRPCWTPLFVDLECGFALQRALQRSGFGCVSGVYSMGCSEAIDEWLGDGWIEVYAWPDRPMGLCFVDPNGYPDWTAIRRLATSRRFGKMDLLINLNSTVHKRCFGSPVHDELLRPTQHLAALGKLHIYLWNPHPSDRHKFTLAYCTNGPFPKFESLGFYPIESDKGRRLARHVDYTPAERASMEPPPGFFPGFGDLV